MKQQPCFLCVYVPEFPAQARLRFRPELRSQAVAILQGTPPLQTVCSITRRARNLGIAPGTTRAELESYSGVHTLLRSTADETSAVTAMLSLLWDYSPRVELVPARNSAQRFVLDAAGSERMYGDPEALAAGIMQTAKAYGFAVQIGVSQNFHAAICAAQVAGRRPHVIEPGTEPRCLAPLPLDVLDALTAEQRDVLALWGVRTFGELAALPETELVIRMGQAGRQLRLLACGEHPHLFRPEAEQAKFEETATLDTGVENLESLLFLFRPMLQQLIQRAASRALALTSITVNLTLSQYTAEESTKVEETATYTRTIRPALPAIECSLLLKLLYLELQSHPPQAPVMAILLSTELGEPARAQLDFFQLPAHEHSQLEITLARIRALVGDLRVGSPRLLDTTKPDGFVIEPFRPLASFHSLHEFRRKMQAKSSSNHSQPVPQQGTFALRRMRRSSKLRVRSTTDKPKHFYWHGTRYTVTAAVGPWKYSGHWWSTGAWSHEEWDITATTKSGLVLVCRMARNLLQDRWSMEGVYD